MLVIGTFLVAVIVSIAVGSERPYPGIALGSGLLLELERAVAIWAVALLGLVVGDQALVGRLPDEISGRGVRYVSQGELDGVVEATVEVGDDLAGRLGTVEVAIENLERRIGND